MLRFLPNKSDNQVYFVLETNGKKDTNAACEDFSEKKLQAAAMYGKAVDDHCAVVRTNSRHFCMKQVPKSLFEKS